MKDAIKDQVLYAFHVECNHPTLEDIGRWVSKYPQYKEDILSHAGIARDWSAQDDVIAMHDAFEQIKPSDLRGAQSAFMAGWHAGLKHGRKP